MAETKKSIQQKVEEIRPVAEAAVKSVAKTATQTAQKVAKEMTPVLEEAKKESAEKTAAVKKAVQKAVNKTEVKSTLHVQFGGRSYSEDELIKIVKDIWKYDLKQKVKDFETVEIYVKPEESIAYYVINGDVNGSFFI